MKILVIDNYDSFTFNLVQAVGAFTRDIIVKRNDAVDIDGIRAFMPDKILISPGPGKPTDSGISLELIKEFGKQVPIFGVCLGHQSIAYVHGAEIVKAPELMHGKSSPVKHDSKTIYTNIPQLFDAGRYHSLIIDRRTLPEEFEITSETENGIIMGIRHKQFPMEGIQFHPESVLTPLGDQIIKNWIEQ